MNPHKLFASISAITIALIFLNAGTSAKREEVVPMVEFLGFAAIVMSCVLLLTRKYWKNARRLV